MASIFSTYEFHSNLDLTKILPFPSHEHNNEINHIDSSNSDNNPPELLLLNSVKPVVVLTKLVGLFPIRIKSNGSVQHKWFSKEILYSLIYVIVFCTTSALYIPFVFHTIRIMNAERGIVSFISELIFFMGQYTASIVTLILNQWMSPRIAFSWNQIQNVTTYFGKQQDGLKHYKSTFIITRALFIIWFLFVIGYAIFFNIYFWSAFSIYFKKDSSSYFIFYFLGYILFCVQMSGHLLHIIVAGTFLRMLEHSLVGLSKIIPNQVIDKESFLKFYNTFCYIEKIIIKLNTTFGLYTIIQIIVMVTSTLVNSYFTIYIDHGRQRGFIILMAPLLVVLYSLWLLRVCNSGERIQNQSMKVMKTLRQAAVFQLNPEDNMKIAGLLGRLSGDPIIITASGFLRINRQLMAKVFITMTTYLIFLVQIKVELVPQPTQTESSTIA